jgi:hypothetical protein
MKLIAILFAMGTTLALGCMRHDRRQTTKASPFPIVVRGNEHDHDRHRRDPARQASRRASLVLQQRDASARRCYQDVLNEKKTREFKGTDKNSAFAQHQRHRAAP